jgi:hypothetical protein
MPKAIHRPTRQPTTSANHSQTKISCQTINDPPAQKPHADPQNEPHEPQTIHTNHPAQPGPPPTDTSSQSNNADTHDNDADPSPDAQTQHQPSE